jgi:hypothetical protein
VNTQDDEYRWEERTSLKNKMERAEMAAMMVDDESMGKATTG